MIRIYQLTFILTEYMLHEFSHAPDAQYTNETLACHGFIGATPDKHVLAFSFKLFKIYHQLHCVCPWLSLDAFSACLSHLHCVNKLFIAILNVLLTKLQVPKKSHLTEQLSSVYDCYLEIICAVDA